MLKDLEKSLYEFGDSFGLISLKDICYGKIGKVSLKTLAYF